MRETRLSGSEGGGFEFNRFSLPLSDPRARTFAAMCSFRLLILTLEERPFVASNAGLLLLI